MNNDKLMDENKPFSIPLSFISSSNYNLNKEKMSVSQNVPIALRKQGAKFMPDTHKFHDICCMRCIQCAKHIN